MPNKKAKKRKEERRKKNEYLKRHGRTKKQIARFKKRAGTTEGRERWPYKR